MVGTQDQINDYAPASYNVIWATQWVGQSFKAGLTGKLDRLRLYIYKNGTPNADLIIKIYTSDANNLPIILLKSQTFPVANVPTSGRSNFDFDVANQADLTANSIYCFVVTSTCTNDGYHFEASGTNTGYANGTTCYSTNGGSNWLTTGYDESFTTYVITAVNYNRTVTELFGGLESVPSKYKGAVHLSTEKLGGLDNISSILGLIVVVTDEDLSTHTGYEWDEVTYTATVFDSHDNPLPSNFLVSLKYDEIETILVLNQPLDDSVYNQVTGLLTLVWHVPSGDIDSYTVKLEWSTQE